MTLATSFHMPSRVEVDESTRTPTYAKFTAEPFQTGFAHTLGNSLRRILLSSLDGAAVSAVRIEGVPHEFMSKENIVEDVTDIILNIKKVKLICHGDTPRTVEIRKRAAGPVTAGDIITDGSIEIVNPEQLICHLDKDGDFFAELEVIKGRGFRPAERNKFIGDERDKQERPIGWIPVDCIFSPVKRVRYEVGNARVGEETELDSLVMEIWTDGRVKPEDALVKSAAILKEHLAPFIGGDGKDEKNASPPEVMSGEKRKLFDTLMQSIDTLELSCRAKNCLDNANITTLGQLCTKSEKMLLKYKNFGGKSLDEIKEKLVPLGLSLGMVLDDDIVRALEAAIPSQQPATDKTATEEA